MKFNAKRFENVLNSINPTTAINLLMDVKQINEAISENNTRKFELSMNILIQRSDFLIRDKQVSKKDLSWFISQLNGGLEIVI